MARSKNFWDREYTRGGHLALSDVHAEDLEKFTRFLERRSGRSQLNVTARLLDVGCGNGRNAIYLSRTFGMHGLGYDLSPEAIKAAREAAEGLPLTFEVRSLAEPIPLPDESVTLALDMMASHYLKRAEREALRAELHRVLKPGGWLFVKTFLRDEDRNAEELLREYPGPEEGMYIHPEIKKAEYVPWEHDLYAFFEPLFTIHKVERSHKHLDKYNRAWKRRTASLYLERE